MNDPTMKRGSHTWEILQDLSSGTGQGNVWIVAKRGNAEPTERMFQALSRAIVKAIKTPEDIETGRREFEKAMLDFVEHRYTIGALKQLKNLGDNEARARLRTEAALYGTISDPHLVALLDVNLAETEHWIVTEYQPNGTLENRLASFKGNAVGTLKAIRPAVNVLARMHSENFIHRDFKPGNIFIGRKGQFVLGDAGLAFYDNNQERCTQSYENVGTRLYMPAWAYDKRSTINPTFDAFSVGKVIWAMIAGRPACSLWYFRKPENDLTRLFPNQLEMQWINRLLDRCVVEEENQMKISNGAEFLTAIDSTIRAIEAQAIPPELVHSDRVLFPCRVCSIGDYLPAQMSLGNDVNGSPGKAYKCSQCGHVEFFYKP